MQDLPSEVSDKTKLDNPPKKTACSLFYKDMQEKKNELKGATVSQASTIMLSGWKKVKVNDKEIKKYSDLCEAKKQRYEEDLQRYKEDHIDKVEIINLHKKYNKTDAKASEKAGVKTSAKTPNSGCHLFWGNSLTRWQERIEETIKVLYQDG